MVECIGGETTSKMLPRMWNFWTSSIVSPSHLYSKMPKHICVDRKGHGFDAIRFFAVATGVRRPSHSETKRNTPDKSRSVKRSPEEILHSATSAIVEYSQNPKRHRATMRIVNVCVSELGKEQRLQEAFRIAGMMAQVGLAPDIVTYTTLISACGACENPDLAIAVFRAMERKGLAPNLITYNAMAKAMHLGKKYNTGIYVLDMIEASGYSPNASSFTIRIGLHGKLLQIEKAFETFHEMVDRKLQMNTVVYGALLQACTDALELDRAVVVLQALLNSGLRPNAVVYNTLINLCSKVGKLDMVVDLFAAMQRDNVKADTVTYNTLVFAHGRLGQLKEAESVFEKASSTGYADAFTFVTLMHIYLKHSMHYNAFQLFLRMQSAGIGVDVPALRVASACVTSVSEMAIVLEEMVKQRKQGYSPDASLYEAAGVALFRLEATVEGNSEEQQWQEQNETLQQLMIADGFTVGSESKEATTSTTSARADANPAVSVMGDNDRLGNGKAMYQR
jgi:pentatricopeptide repeat protein